MLLSHHGTAFINRVEQEAQLNSRLNYLLGGVWRSDMPQARAAAQGLESGGARVRAMPHHRLGGY